jgi:hypothetical protein
MTLPSGHLKPEVPGQLRLIAQFMANPGSTPPDNVAAACDAIAGVEGMFEQLRDEFETITHGTETLHWYSPHRLKGDLVPSCRAIAVSSVGLTEEEATRFYWLDWVGNTTIRQAEPELDTATLFDRMYRARSWDLVEEHHQEADAWITAFSAALVRHLREAPAHSDPAVNLLVKDVVNARKRPTLGSVIVAYLAMGLDPGASLRYAIRELRLPHHNVPLGGEPGSS